MTTTDTMEKIDKIMTKVKFSAFGKVKKKPAIDDNKVDEIMNNDEDNPNEINQKRLDHQRKEA